LFPHAKNTSIKIITDTYDLERCFLSSHSQGSLQIGKDGVLLHLGAKQILKLMGMGSLYDSEKIVR
ncbi:hypothetical protein, partial [Bacillus toyonensis]